MSERTDKSRLLDELLADGVPSAESGQALDAMLGQARARRRRRQAARLTMALGLVGLVSWCAWRPRPAPLPMGVPPVAAREASSGVILVSTRPLASSARVGTGAYGSIPEVSTAVTVAKIQTADGGFQFIGDAELLSVLGPGQALLVQTGPGAEELVWGREN